MAIVDRAGCGAITSNMLKDTQNRMTSRPIRARNPGAETAPSSPGTVNPSLSDSKIANSCFPPVAPAFRGGLSLQGKQQNGAAVERWFCESGP
jgi:hypothetical protein